MSDELSQEIDLLRSLNNYRGISEINGLSVDEDGNVDFDLNEIRLSDRAMSSVKGFYTNTQLLNSLKSTFPQWTDRVDLQNTKYSAAM